MFSSTRYDNIAETDGATAAQAPEAAGDVTRRSFLATGVAVGAGAALAPLGRATAAFASPPSGTLTNGDVALLRFRAAAEILETDLWQQYNELGGIQDSQVPGGSGSKFYTRALENIDENMPQYIHDNTHDELSHFSFLNAYLESRGAEPVNLDKYRQLPSSKAAGARQIGRLTNLMELTIDTSWWTRYRSSTKNPDLGDKFAQAVPDLFAGSFPAIPRSDDDLHPHKHIQAIANTAAFHFGTIEQGGTSNYPQLAQRVTDLEVLRVMLSFGGVETMHFQTWNDKAGNVPPIKDPTNGLEFPNLNDPPFGNEELKANLIMPEPTVFLNKSLPVASIVRPTKTQGAATGAVAFLTADGLFKGQSTEFFEVLKRLATEADAATRE